MSIIERKPDHRVVGGGLRDAAVLVDGAGDFAVDQSPAARAAGFQP